MKTTVEISAPLLLAARDHAKREGVTLASLIERGLNRVLFEADAPVPFKLSRASVKGKGLRPELRGAAWDRILDLIYEERAG